MLGPEFAVALRKESVDRNNVIYLALAYRTVSLSARRAWIEIVMWMALISLIPVALRKESVDRNSAQSNIIKIIPGSLSARRAWIEIFAPTGPGPCFGSRSPQGERG